MTDLINLLYQYRYLALFPLAIVEGPILAVVTGFLCTRGLFNFWIVLPVIVLGDMISDSVCFFFGRFGIPGVLKRIVYRLGINSEKVRRVKIFIETHPKSFIPLSKVTLGIGVVGIYLTGSTGVAYTRFIRICLITSVCQYIFYLGIGLLFGEAYLQINQYLNNLASFFIILSISGVTIYFIQSIRRRL